MVPRRRDSEQTSLSKSFTAFLLNLFVAIQSIKVFFCSFILIFCFSFFVYKKRKDSIEYVKKNICGFGKLM